MDNEIEIFKELTETTQRCKSNTYQIEEMKEDIKDLRAENKAIYDLVTTTKLIAQDMGSIKKDVADVKKGQSDLSDKVDAEISKVKEKITQVENKDDIELGKSVKKNANKIVFEISKWIVVGGLGFFASIIVQSLMNTAK